MRKQPGTGATYQEIRFSEAGVQQLKAYREENDHLAAYRDQKIKTDDDLLYNFPVVYVIKNEEKTHAKPYTAYVGETTDIIQRTTSHLKNTRKDDADWTKLKDSKNSSLIILGHELFNKSLTLDVENRLMLMLSSVESVKSSRTGEVMTSWTITLKSALTRYSMKFGDSYRLLIKICFRNWRRFTTPLFTRPLLSTA
ncbi:GIY-YIG nuclease family protein [Corynebacterium sp. 22_2729]